MAWVTVEDCDIDDFCGQIDAAKQATPVLNWAAEIVDDIPIYDCSAMLDELAGDARRDILGEWHSVMSDGAGGLVLRGAYADTSAIDAATVIFNRIMEEQRAAGGDGADHFGKAGANDRIWNSLEKLCHADPDVFARYFANPFVAAVSEAWLGPHYQVTTQTNLVHPGGEGQTAHRDYHLGFQTPEDAVRYPAIFHAQSPYLTLQGGIAHVDMPVASGPTKLLPYSQQYLPGYLAYRLPEFRDFFDENYVQLPLQKGDALFFNPALFHGAGSNSTKDVARLINLLQVSSAYGRSLEAIGRHKMCLALYPALLTSDLSKAEQNAAIAACAEGYPFPTNLDRDPPIGGLAPPSQADLMRASLAAKDSLATFKTKLEDHAQRRLT
jgi:ectoine hydroxylase-related dioxygenase (phytanoyl-CoA dioxygenase family)